VVGRRIGDEFVLVPLAGRGADIDSILNLNRVGTFIWEQLDGRRTGGEIVDALVERFEVERPRAAEDYRDFLARLRGLGAVVSTSGGEG
jgi:methyltransferase-like protein